MFDDYEDEDEDLDDSIYNDINEADYLDDDDYHKDYEDFRYDEKDDEKLKEYIRSGFAEKSGFKEKDLEVKINRPYLDIEEEPTVELLDDKTFLIIHIKSEIPAVQTGSDEFNSKELLFVKELLYQVGKEEDAEDLNFGESYYMDLSFSLNLEEKRICAGILDLYTDRGRIKSIEIYNTYSLDKAEDYEDSYMSLEEIEEEIEMVFMRLFGYDDFWENDEY